MIARAALVCTLVVGCASDPSPKELVWVHTSAEYAALCMQTFNGALRAIDESKRQGTLPPAIVMDLDETVLDTFDFQLKLARGEVDFDSDSWSRWVHSDRSSLVPGARRFIEEVRKRNVKVLFLSNRIVHDADATLATLRRLGAVPRALKPELFLRNEDPSKEGRRQDIEKRYEVLAYFGDNLADMGAAFEADSVEARYRAVCDTRERFGVRWFLLPNPMYGGWQQPSAERDLAAARPECD